MLSSSDTRVPTGNRGESGGNVPHTVAVLSLSYRATATEGASTTRATSSATAVKSSRGCTPRATSMAIRRSAACSRAVCGGAVTSRFASATTARIEKGLASCSSVGSRLFRADDAEAERYEQLIGSGPE
jgi:hypothetical protein